MSDQEIIGPKDRFDDPFAAAPFEEPRSGMSARSKVFASGAMLIGVIALGAVSWYAFQQGLRSGTERDAPVIHAESKPIKRKPSEPGGLNVPHQDKLVFNRLAPGQVQEPAERLLPPPEEPAKRPQPAPPEPAITQVEPETPAPQALSPPSEQMLPPAAALVTTVEVLPSPPSQPSAASLEAPAETQQAALPPAPALESTSAAAAASATVGEWKIQISAVSSQAAVQSEWRRIQSRHTDLLGRLNLNVQPATLPQGTFYRIQAGPFVNRDAASALCARLKGQKQDCLVVAP